MRTLSVRVSDGDYGLIEREARSRGVSVSELVRHRLGLGAEGLASSGVDERMDDFERRLSRLEELASGY